MKLKQGIDRIKEMVEAIRNTDIEEISYEKEGLNIAIKVKPEGGDVSEADSSGAGKIEQKEKKASPKVVEVFSHSVGLFRDYVLPSRKIMARPGQSVKKGQNLGAIESMKIMKEVVSPVNGKIRDKLVKHGDPIEYGQKLFEIEERV